ncbi:hypothetical protein IWX88_000932 [Frigoribacterium sp. CG_9.8]|nr:hypothetical protein [Frigoribacterium sp. CG_9.8]
MTEQRYQDAAFLIPVLMIALAINHLPILL